MAQRDVISFLIELEDRMSGQLAGLSRQSDQLSADLKRLNKGTGDIDKSSAAATLTMGHLKAAMAAAAVGATAIAAAYTTLGKNAIKTSADLEKFETRLGILLGSLDAGRKRVNDLFAIAGSTPFSIAGLVEAESTLEAFGVNAEVVRSGVMDLAGAMGMDVVEAANAVGKALAGGAGAADILRDKGVLAMVEVTAGMKTADMTIDQFRAALVETLNENEKLAGGTEKLAGTYAGLMSTLKDQFTGFAKMVGDSQLFEAAKLVLADILELLGDNTDETRNLAGVIGGQLTKGLLFIVQHFGEMVAMVARVTKGMLALEQITVAYDAMVNRLTDAWLKTGQAFNAFFRDVGEALGIQGDHSETQIERLQREREANHRIYQSIIDQNDGLRRQQQHLENVINKFGNAKVAVDEIKLELARLDNTSVDVKLQYVDENGNPVPPPGEQGPVMSGSGIPDAPAGDGAGAAAGSFDIDAFASEVQGIFDDAANTAMTSRDATVKFTGELRGFEAQAAKAAKAASSGAMSQDQMGTTLTTLRNKYLEARAEAERLGPEAVGAFKHAEEGIIASIKNIEKAAKSGPSFGQVAQAGVGVMQDGGMGMLAGAGPGGAAAAGMISLGQAGAQAADAAVDQEAAAIAQERQESMQAEADQMAAQGFSADEIAAAGLGEEDIAAAGEVTEEDKKAAEGEVDRDQVMADQVTAVITGIIDGIKGIITGLPEILSDLIPMLLIDLPTAIIESLPELIEQLIPLLIFELPKAIFIMLVKLIPKLVKLIFVKIPEALFNGFKRGFQSIWRVVSKFFADLFSFGIFQTGGLVPKTQMALVHQGERIIPSDGAGSQTATRGLQAFTGNQGPSVTINTSVVDPDSISALGRMLDRELGSMGRTTNPLFGDVAPTTTI